MTVGLVGGDEARPDPDAHRAQRQRGGEPAPVGDATRRYHGHRRHRVRRGGDQHHAADTARVPARLVTLGDDDVHAVRRVVARLLDVAAQGHDFHAEPVGLGGDGAGVPEAGDEHRHALLEGDVGPALDLVGELLRLFAHGADRREEDVDAEGLVCQVAHPADLFAQVFRRSVGSGDDAEAAGRGNGSRQ